MEFRELQVGTVFPTLNVTLSAAANERYWASAGVDHPLLRGGALYPPIAANLTVLLVQQLSPGALLHTEEALTSRNGGAAGAEVAVTGTVTDAFEKRGRDYVVVQGEVAAGTTSLWRSRATFTPTGARRRPTPDGAESREPRPQREPFPDDALRRSLALTADALRAYSRSGNFHSDPDEARRLGMPGLVAQGMQVCGPAYGLLLDAWGAEFLDGGRLTARFVGMVVDGQTVDAAVVHDDERARFEVRDETDRVVAFGTAHRRRNDGKPAR